MLKAVWRPLLVAFATSLLAHVHWIALPLVLLFIADTLLCAAAYGALRGSEISMERLRLMRHTWCSRGVATAAWGRTAAAYFQSHGYRAWHVLPDGFPRVCLSRLFWARFFQTDN